MAEALQNVYIRVYRRRVYTNIYLSISTSFPELYVLGTSPKQSLQNGCRRRSNRQITLHNIPVVSLCASGLFVMQRPPITSSTGYDYSVRIAFNFDSLP